jgi:hypothetical protein
MNVTYPAKDRRGVTLSVAGALLVTTLMASGIVSLFDADARSTMSTPSLVAQAREALQTKAQPEPTSSTISKATSRFIGRAL